MAMLSRRWCASAALGLACTLVPLAAVQAQPASASTQPAVLTVAPIAFTQRTLANGMQVIAVPRPGGGRVSVQVWYRVGGKDDPQGRSGFAHLFEHLMFKRTKHLADEQFDRLTEDVGGHNNAFTAEDVTAYFETVPANHLQRLLWAEAERMANLAVDEGNFKSERQVVKEEYRQRVLADPYGLLYNAISPALFDVHPYHRPVIGSIEDLDAASLDDVRAFHATFYRPDNAVLIVAGDFVPAQLDGWVDRYFAPLVTPKAAVPRVAQQEPAWTAGKTLSVTGPSVPFPAVMLLWQAPKASGRDAAALQVAQALLAGGASSRLHEALVYRQQIAQEATLELMLNADAGGVAAYAIAAGPRQAEDLVKPLLGEIERLATTPIPAAELAKVRTQLVTAALKERETNEGTAMALGWAVIRFGDPKAADAELAALQAVTAEDVQRVLREYLLSKPYRTLTYTQADQKEGA